VHCDVGGGYPEAESGLSKIALEWMLDEAEQHGLQVVAARKQEVLGRVPGTAYVAPDPNGRMHESLSGAWHMMEYVPKPHFDWATGREGRRMNRGRRRTLPAASLVHRSAFERGGGYAQRLPADAVKV
jgi:hypothetical protein